MRTAILLSGLTIALSACERDRPPEPSAEEADQLNEVDDLLNAMADEEKGPEDNAPGPSN